MNAATLDGYQSAARRTINRALSDEQRLLDAAAGLAEEAGEVLSHVRKHVMRGRTLDRDAVILELGDALWCVAVVADTLGISLNDVALRNVEKLHLRYPD
ncbi:MAG: MazG nucleotide pyrophosphohydrolase domain-containing protein [Gemmatimonadaceae bacterium]